MHSPFWSSPLGRIVIGLGVFTFSFWALAAATLFAWSPSRGVAMAAVTRLGTHAVRAANAAAVPDTKEDSCSAMCDDAAGYAYDYSTGSEDEDFGWAVLEGNGSMTIDGGEPDHVRGNARHGQPVFWFRDGDDEFWVTDRTLVAEASRASARVRELGREMGKVGSEMGRHGAAMGRIGGRMGAIGARMGMVEAQIATSPNLSDDDRERQKELLARPARPAPRPAAAARRPARRARALAAPAVAAHVGAVGAAPGRTARRARTAARHRAPVRAARERRSDRTRTREAHWGARLHRRSAS
jgi:hypothetical protein